MANSIISLNQITTSIQWSDVLKDKPWRHIVGRVSMLARIPVYLVALGLQTAKIPAKMVIAPFATTINWANGQKYVGLYGKDRRNGQGKMVWPDGTTYSGQWKNGNADGPGSITNAEGTTTSGIWRDGMFEGCQRELDCPPTEDRPRESDMP